MLQLNKRQVKSLLDIISKEEHRHIINCVTVQEVDGKFYLVATDSYKMALLVVDSEELLEFKDKLLNREVLTRWYKLASAKDYLTERTLVGMFKDGDNLVSGDYPRVEGLMNVTPTPVDGFKFNASYMLSLETLNGGEPLEYKTSGYRSPAIAEHDGNKFVIMPINK
jgi:hypothetical protein